MKITYASDLHFEFHRENKHWVPKIQEGCDVILLVGDIDIGDNTIEAIHRIHDQHPSSKVIWVAGNHDFYRADIHEQSIRFKSAFTNHPSIHFLEKDVVEVDGYSFLGCTLWTGFEDPDGILKQSAMDMSRLYVTDFQRIRQRGKLFTPEDAATIYLESSNWLDIELSVRDPGKCIVITHFPPSFQLRNTNFEIDPVTYYFGADCDDLIEKHQPVLWVYGHNHQSNDLMIQSTRCVSNQLGYPGTGEMEQFRQVEILL